MAETKTADPTLVAKIVGRYVSHNSIAASDLPNLIAVVHRSLAELGEPLAVALAPKPAVAINRSYSRDLVVCLDCGWRGVVLRRHLTVSHGRSARDYRARWNLKDTHPLIAPAYSARRSTLAKQPRLGRPRSTLAVAADAPAPTPKRRGRPRKAAPAPTTP